MPRAGKPTSSASSSSQRPLRTKTVPEMFLKQKTTAKKRRIIQNGYSSNEEEEEDELNSSDNDSENENELASSKKTAARRKKARKTPANIVLDTNSQLLEQVSQSSSAQEALYDKALIPENNMDDVVEGWVKQYKYNQLTALRNLINFVIRSSGCSIAVTADALEQEDGPFVVLEELQNELTKLPHTEYPIISRSKENKVLKRNLLLFFQELIDQCQKGAIYDGVLIETLQSWLTTMSSSTYRPFRHTSTLIAFTIINQLCIIAEKTRSELNQTTRQITAEKKKKNSNNDRIKMLKRTHTTAQSRCKDLEEYLTDFFEGIFIHRSRDVESVIRHECYKELCNWMLNYQGFFVNNGYLRYYGWSFNDQSPSVRSETIKSLIKLYKVEDIATKLSIFTNRFMPRIEEMALFDLDVSVRVHAIQLCSALFKLKVNVLSEKGRKQVSNMIASDVPRVRKSAAPFVKALIDTNMIEPLVENITGSLSGGRRSQVSVSVNRTWVTFKAVASFLVEQSTSILEKENGDEMQLDLESLSSTLAEKRNSIITNVVEALWDQMPELQDYATMSDYLSRDHSQSQQDDDEMDTGNDIEDCYRLTEDEETVLINVFVTCIRTAMVKGLDKNMPEGTKDKRKLDSAFFEENKNELSRHLVQVLPKLLSKHSDDTNRMTQLVTLPALMNLNVYLELRAEQEYEALLQKLVKVYLGAILTELLTNCADSLQHMIKNISLAEINKIHMSDLTDAVVNQVRDVCSGKDLVTANYSPALIHSVSVSMLRLASLINFTDVAVAMDDAQGMSMSVTDYVGALADRAVFGHKKEKNIHLSTLLVLSRYMMWKCNALSASSNANEVVPVLERRRDWAIDKFSELVKGADVTPLHDVRVAAFGHLIDMYWLFTSDFLATYGLARLKTKCPVDLQRSCADYFVQEITAVKNANATDKTLTEQKESLRMLTSSFSRGVLMGVFDISYTALLLEQYGLNDMDMDETIRTLVAEFQTDLISSEVAADGICRAYLTALKNSFNEHVSDSIRSIDKTMKLARLEAQSIKGADAEDPARKIPSHVVCERIHLDGISFALAKANDAYQNKKDDERDNALKFFKILTTFANVLTRARDIAKIHNHLEDCLRENGLFVEENKKEWEHYTAYVQAINQILTKKGLRYDATKRANNAETPAAHVFNDVTLGTDMEDVNDLAVRDSNRLTVADMEIDE